MITYTCPECEFTLTLSEPLKYLQICPVCEKGQLSGGKDIAVPKKNQIKTPDNQRDLNWSMINIDSAQYPVAMKSLFAHSLVAMLESNTDPEALRFFENVAIRIMGVWRINKRNCGDFICGWTDAAVVSTIHMSRYIRIRAKRKFNPMLEKAYLIYTGIPEDTVNALENDGWEDEDI